HLDGVDGHRVADELRGHERGNRLDPADLAAVVVDVGVVGEGRDDPVEVERVDGPQVLADHGGGLVEGDDLHGDVLSGYWEPVSVTLRAPGAGESRGRPALDSPPGGASRLETHEHGSAFDRRLLARHAP